MAETHVVSGLVAKHTERAVQSAEFVHLTIPHAMKARAVAFSHVVGNALNSAIFNAVIHTACVEFGMQRIVSVGFIGADDRAFFTNE